MLVGLLERIANDFRAGVLGVHFVYQALEVVFGLGRTSVDHGCTVSGKLMDDGTAYELRSPSSDADEAILPRRLAKCSKRWLYQDEATYQLAVCAIRREVLAFGLLANTHG